MAEKELIIYDVPYVKHRGDDLWEVIVSEKALPRLEKTYQVDGKYVPWHFDDVPNKSRNMIAAELSAIRDYSARAATDTMLIQRIREAHLGKRIPHFLPVFKYPTDRPSNSRATSSDMTKR